jgi:hypothetical protein
MKNRSLLSCGVFLCTPFAPMALPKKEEEQHIEEKQNFWGSSIEFFQAPPELGIPLYIESLEALKPFEFKPVSYFLRKDIPLCTVFAVPYQRDAVHKPPWFQR